MLMSLNRMVISHEMRRLAPKKKEAYLQAKDAPVAVHIHVRDMAINKLIKDKDGPVNQNDCWHGYKGLKKDMQAIVSGLKYKNESHVAYTAGRQG